jgi:hypothetical protein
MEPLTQIISNFRGDPAKGQVHNPPPPFLATDEPRVGLLYVISPKDHPALHKHIPYFNREGIELNEGDEVEFETGFLAPDEGEERIYFADKLKKVA